jgi:FAD/FMN-containing dehydrogenase
VKQGREKLAAFASRSASDLSDAELYEYALLVEEFESVDRAFEMYRTLFVHGARGGAKFAYARLLLDRDDDAGVILLEEVMEDLPAATLPACDLIVGYLHRHGRQDEARPYIDRYYARQQHEHSARVARETIRITDKFLPHELGAESLAALKAMLARHKKQVKLAYLVRKQLPEGEPPLHVVGVLRRTGLFALERSSANQKLLSLLAGEMRTSDDIVLIGLNGVQKTFIKPLKKVKGSRIA